MAEKKLLSKAVTSLSELQDILRTCDRPNYNELDETAIKTLLSGFRWIVDYFENDKNGVNLDVAMDWLRLFLRAQIIMSKPLNKVNYFPKAVPIAVTYIIGWLKLAPSTDPNFYTSILNMTWKMIHLADPKVLKRLETSGYESITLLWDVIDKVGQFNTQMQVLELFILILKNVSKNLAFWAVSDVENIRSHEICYKIMDLTRMSGEDDFFKKLARSILNQYNSDRESKALVRSFCCKSIEMGTSVKFLRPKYSNFFWFDINTNPYTLTFEGRITPKGLKKYQNVNVSLKIKDMFFDKNFINVKFQPPAEVTGFKLTCEDLLFLDLARLSLSKKECHRFIQSLNISSKPSSDVQILSVVDVTPNFSIGSANNSKKITNMTHLFDTANQNQVQQVNPLFQNISSDVYDNIDLSDAEPVQSYKNFLKRKSVTISTESSIAKTPRKRSLPNGNLVNQPSPCKILKTISCQDDQPSTSKGIISGATFLNNDFDELRNGISPTNVTSNGYAHINMGSKYPTELENNAAYFSNLKTPESEIKIELSKIKKINTVLVAYEPSQTMVSYKHISEDRLVYHKRSDTESSSDESDYQRRGTPIKKSFRTLNSNVKRHLFGRNCMRSPSPSDSDCDVAEFVILSKQDLHGNLQRMKTVLSSFFKNNIQHAFKHKQNSMQILGEIANSGCINFKETDFKETP